MRDGWISSKVLYQHIKTGALYPGNKNQGNLVGMYNPRGNGRGETHGHMTACCYAACSKEACDNADRGPQQRRSDA